MIKEYELELKLKAKVKSDCPMRAADKLVRYVLNGPYEVVDWGFTSSIYPELRTGTHTYHCKRCGKQYESSSLWRPCPHCGAPWAYQVRLLFKELG